ncbi:dipeptide ABC transporter ATP-binding protein [Lacisediminihabitans profunda]|uniref:ABC transporter ATP-binding protein n=1 Tax=Lacisediminihabitans profunda TaxID=2594790 RepID=A0A5C8UUY4_9MICO|nr:ABC transporter ATP-binding protein [Lacisediminihabitans profunda]TXN31409.1 ABC transporter ATP-binding protein [Lacisediminihabitans profunda]
MTLVSVRDLAVSFGGTTVVSGVDFDIEAGQCVALVGESGSGKSVTARALLGLTGGSVNAAELRFHDTDLRSASPSRLRRLRGREIGFVSQGALVALDPLRPVGREIEDSLRIHTRLGAAQRRARAIELLAEAGVPQAAERAAQRPDELSGGLRQRALIASAIALRPRLLIADEPTTALDTTVQAGILDLLESLRDAGTAILLISHDLAVVSRLASHLVVMSEGRVVESGPAERVLAEPRHPYTRRLIAAVPTDRPRFERLTDRPAAAPAADRPQASRDVVLSATGLRREFGSRVAVDGVGFALGRGKTLGIVGESGSGKTTVARLVLALERPDAGEVRLLGRPWSTLTEPQRRERRPGIGAIYQDALSSFDPRLTVGQILADALSGGRSRRASPEVVALMESVGLQASLASRRPRLLSGGQQQRVAIARAIAPRPHILVCDEPVSSLDVSVQAQVLDLLDDLQRSLGLSYLFITHDLGVVRHMSDDLLVMRHGRVLEAGPTESVFSRPRHDYTRALIDSAPRLG